MCGDGVGWATGHCVSTTRSHQDSHFTHPLWLPGINPSKGLIFDYAVVTINWRLRTNWGVLEIDSASCPCRKFLPRQWSGLCQGRAYTPVEALLQPPKSMKDLVTGCSWLCLGPGLAAAHVHRQTRLARCLTSRTSPNPESLGGPLTYLFPITRDLW